MGITSITFGTLTLNGTTLDVAYVEPTIKQKVGTSLVQIQVPRDIKDLQVTVSGFLTDPATRDTDIDALNVLNDAEPHTYTDGVRNNKQMIMIPSSLRINHTVDAQEVYTYSFDLIEYNQV